MAVTNNNALPLTNYEGIRLAVGDATNVKISRASITHLDFPYSNCRMDVSKVLPNDNSLFKRTLELNEYSVNLCYDLCLQRDYINLKCNCSEPSIALFNESFPICDTIKQLKCATDIRDKFDNEINIDDACSKYCPIPCNKNNYDLSTSIADYPTDYYFEILKNSSNLKSKFKEYLKDKKLIN